ncbi:MAG: hypothetical protein ACREF4_06665 [Gammaproteobacteria bacterium]
MNQVDIEGEAVLAQDFRGGVSDDDAGSLGRRVDVEGAKQLRPGERDGNRDDTRQVLESVNEAVLEVECLGGAGVGDGQCQSSLPVQRFVA